MYKYILYLLYTYTLEIRRTRPDPESYTARHGLYYNQTSSSGSFFLMQTILFILLQEKIKITIFRLKNSLFHFSHFNTVQIRMKGKQKARLLYFFTASEFFKRKFVIFADLCQLLTQSRCPIRIGRHQDCYNFIQRSNL